MARHKRTYEPLPTIWQVSDRLWQRIETVLNELDPPARTGRKRIPLRPALNGIIYEMRTGCQWNALPRVFGDDSSVHRTFQRWIRKGILDRIWASLVAECQELGGVHWRWQVVDGALGKARFGGAKSAPTPRIAAKRASNAASSSRRRAARWPR
jgi:putative transposase